MSYLLMTLHFVIYVSVYVRISFSPLTYFRGRGDELSAHNETLTLLDLDSWSYFSPTDFMFSSVLLFFASVQF